MKKLSILSAIFGMFFMGAASAADITVYYSPTCPHCHHARDFISSTLIYEYPELKVSEVNVTNQDAFPMFQEALKKCEYESGGVPVLVIGEKCFQGYADVMQQELRDAIEADMTDEAKATAAENKKALEENPEQFKADNSNRLSAVSEYTAAAAPAPVEQPAAPEVAGSSSIYFYGLLIVLVAALGFVLLRKKK